MLARIIAMFLAKKKNTLTIVKKTNADSIRAMSDEELADLLYEVQMTMSEFWNPKIEVVNTWPDWLKQEVE